MIMRSFRTHSMPKLERPPVFDVLPDDVEHQSADGMSSTASFDRFCVDVFGDAGSVLDSPRDAYWDGDASTTSTSVESSPLGWPRASRERSRLGKLHSISRVISSRDTFDWDQKENKIDQFDASDKSEIDLMKERFSKLLLGEDLSGGGKGVSSALAISNAITNLSASVFGELWRLEPLSQERKTRWKREMGWFLSVSDHIVEFVPSLQELPDGSTTEVMVTKPRSDLHMNLPALRKLDAMLLEALDSFNDTEFWYVDRGRAMTEKDGNVLQRQEEKWWLPSPRLPAEGLSDCARKHLQQQRESINQILKAALAINAQVLSEVEVPNVYWDALPKNGRTSLGEALYRTITSESFSPDSIISSLDSSHEHNILELVNRVEAAIHIWRKKSQSKQGYGINGHNRNMSKAWGMGKDAMGEADKRDQLADKAESLLLLMRHKFPGLPQTILEMNKIQYNKDVGQSILESYSRVLESLAFNILSRIDDVLHVDDLTRCKPVPSLSRNPSGHRTIPDGPVPKLSILAGLTKSSSIHSLGTASSPRSLNSSKSLSEFIGWSMKVATGDTIKQGLFENYSSSPRLNKQWSAYSGNLNTTRSPPSRD